MPITVITAAQLVQKMQEGELEWPPFFNPADSHIYARSVKMDATSEFIVYQV